MTKNLKFTKKRGLIFCVLAAVSIFSFFSQPMLMKYVLFVDIGIILVFVLPAVMVMHILALSGLPLFVPPTDAPPGIPYDQTPLGWAFFITLHTAWLYIIACTIAVYVFKESNITDHG
jgi:hypothetical protein